MAWSMRHGCGLLGCGMGGDRGTGMWVEGHFLKVEFLRCMLVGGRKCYFPYGLDRVCLVA